MMDFWCHASALFALSWARACNSDSQGSAGYSTHTTHVVFWAIAFRI